MDAVVSSWTQHWSSCLRKYIVGAESRSAHKLMMNPQTYLRDKEIERLGLFTLEIRRKDMIKVSEVLLELCKRESDVTGNYSFPCLRAQRQESTQ